jgi:hypothetical protein
LTKRLGAGREGLLQQADEQRGNGPKRPPSGGLGARLMRSLSAQMASQGVRVIQQILLVPFFLRAWGVDLYNDWLLMAAGRRDSQHPGWRHAALFQRTSAGTHGPQ